MLEVVVVVEVEVVVELELPDEVVVMGADVPEVGRLLVWALESCELR